MNIHDQLRPVLVAYPADCQPQSIECLGGAGGFSGARLWRLSAPAGRLCLRRWPKEYPSAAGLEFIQAVLWHVERGGFSLVPAPRRTLNQTGYVRHDGYLWELTPWLAGEASYARQPGRARLMAALSALAQFHCAAASFSTPAGAVPSPGIIQRQGQLQELLSGGFSRLRESISRRETAALWPELAFRSESWFRLAPTFARNLLPKLEAARTTLVRLQPCLRDIWHDHVLFVGDQVSGIVDFGAMRMENIAADLARLLGSLVEDDAEGWAIGRAAYETVRPLIPQEIELLPIFDRSNVLLSGANWLRWVFEEGREFEHRDEILNRFDRGLVRLAALSQVQ